MLHIYMQFSHLKSIKCSYHWLKTLFFRAFLLLSSTASSTKRSVQTTQFSSIAYITFITTHCSFTELYCTRKLLRRITRQWEVLSCQSTKCRNNFQTLSLHHIKKEPRVLIQSSRLMQDQPDISLPLPCAHISVQTYLPSNVHSFWSGVLWRDYLQLMS